MLIGDFKINIFDDSEAKLRAIKSSSIFEGYVILNKLSLETATE